MNKNQSNLKSYEKKFKEIHCKLSYIHPSHSQINPLLHSQFSDNTTIRIKNRCLTLSNISEALLFISVD